MLAAHWRSADFLSVSDMVADSSTSHFELFGLPQSFEVDLGMLDTNYRELQRTMHPDRFVNASDQERRLSMQQATRNNEGYQTLRDPLKRGRYLLELSGYRFDDQHHTTSDTAFLMEQMELREALAEVRGADDPFGALETIMERIATDIVALLMQLQDNFAAADADNLEAAAEALMKMQFFRRLQEEVMDLEATLEDELA
jgi:molecular chaperone HscB